MKFDSRPAFGSLNAQLVAADAGPRETLAPLAAHCGLPLIDVSFDAAEVDSHWQELIKRDQPALLVAGTSDSARGRRVEGAARRAARRADIAIAAIEDFPGNYYPVENGEASLVIVESSAARDIGIRKFGAGAPGIEIAIPARYDAYRERLGELRQKTSARWASTERSAVLWAGQPEADDCMRTLTALLPLLRGAEVDLLFKAHPRDGRYLSGSYLAMLDEAGIRTTDLTACTLTEALTAAPKLVVTQFSSVAIEAGFFGIPSLWVLLPEAGGVRLQQKKGYGVPPLCVAGGAALAADEQALGGAFARSLGDTQYRRSVMQCFDDYFKVHERGTPRLMARLLELQRTLK